LALAAPGCDLIVVVAGEELVVEDKVAVAVVTAVSTPRTCVLP
jgi:uncharacterized membrane protein